MDQRLDETLLKSAGAGDRKSMEQVLAISHPTVHRMALSQCASSADADDATQITLWLVYRRLGTLRAAAAFPAWLFALVRRECWRLARKVAGWVEWTEWSHDVDEQQNLDLRRDLAVAIARLPTKYRRILVLRDVEQRTTEETAALSGLTPEAVKSRLHRARRMLKKALSD